MIIKTWRDPYEIGVSLTKPTTIELNPGLTVLVGCNGSGKTTLINNIEECMRKEHVPCVLYDNLHDGSSSSIGQLFETSGNLSDIASLWTASEGEAIRLNVFMKSKLYNEFLISGYYKDRKYQFSKIFKQDSDVEEQAESNRRVLLFDATDSGVSIDAIYDLLLMFNAILETSQKLGVETYIIVAANEYELCRNNDCFDVVKGKYLRFNDYEDYRKFILNSRICKEKRLDKQAVWCEKQKKKEQDRYNKLVEKIQPKIDKLKRDPNPSFYTRCQIDHLESRLRDFRMNSRFLKV